ncbi:MAG: DUF2807 domain-containing protein [Rikenellaceae bacterium]|jgi:hypothetical protein|nr:DUF2807 domain-containing protein [Rikenellaceae bacterium]
MKKLTVILAVAATLMAADSFAAGITVKASKNYVTKFAEQMQNVDAVNVAGPINVEFNQSRGSEANVQIFAPDNALEFIEVTNSAGMVTVGVRNGVKISGASKLKVIVTCPQLRAAWVTGEANLLFKGDSQFKSLEIKVSGTGNVLADKLGSNSLTVNISGKGGVVCKSLVANTVSANLSGKGSLELRGRTTKADFVTSGSGGVSAEKLDAQEVTARVSGSGGIACAADKSLVASVSGKGKIVYVGTPSSINASGKKENIKQK